MANYSNPTGISPLLPLAGVPGITLPDDFALEAADRALVPGPVPPRQKEEAASITGPVRFPIRNVKDYGEAIARLVGAFSGPGFNLIFRPHSDKDPRLPEKKPTDPPKLNLPADDLLELNLTHEIWTFPRADLGEIPNRAAKPNNFDTPKEGLPRKDIFLRGIPYTQIVREVTDTSIDKGTRVPVDRLGKSNDKEKQKLISDIHFEPGLLVYVEGSTPVSEDATICRMASIPHGTTINAQGAKEVVTNGPLKPKIPKAFPKPFPDSNGSVLNFPQFDVTKSNTTRLPQDLDPFIGKNSIESITDAMVQDPNELIRQHNVNKVFTQVIQFTVATTPTQPLDKQACPHLAARTAMNAALVVLNKAPSPASKEVLDAKKAIAKAMKLCSEPTTTDISSMDDTKKSSITAPAIGTSNIAFLDGDSSDGANPNARTGKVESTFWISTVVYTLNVEKDFVPTKDAEGKVITKDGKAINILEVEPEEKKNPTLKGKFVQDTIPTFVFPAEMPVAAGKYAVEATQIQYSQTVNLIFNTLVWPHISVATVIPVRPVLVTFAKKL